MKLSGYAKKLGTHYNTANRMFQRGQIAGYQLPTGTVIIEEPVEKKRLTNAVFGDVLSNYDTVWYNNILESRT